ncbi:hypothetical protein P168DRAFT_317107 [Aspergillus campestris IBT 28561]|uniref:Uncharacterized protein n=1 Tax=Aspergillus campestris (strain IBT 28561) TaxID=1392248 RepID=A0A2I1D6T4_ASPC2|nr:uncharacterized protein P168DRAFT_317107 [Aspergillus campestris IBT 28561]PKY05585.1 hypothetical protein P168DRAFT_317107 [Aspergillus campestris IBT 28561]
MSTYLSHNLSPNLTKRYNDLLGIFINSQKRPADEELSPCRRQKMKKSNRAFEIITGVGSDGLPFINPDNGIAKNFSRLPVVRKLDWRVDATGDPIRRELKDGTSFVAAFGHTRGEEASKPCSFCRTGKGPWKSCVVIADPLNPDAKHNGYCSNFPLVSSDIEDELPTIHEPEDYNDPNYEPSTTAASSLVGNDGSDDEDLLLLTGLANGAVQKSALSTRRAPKAAGTVEKNKSALSKTYVPPQRGKLSQPRVVKQELQNGCFKGTRGDVLTVPIAQSPAITRPPPNIKKASSSATPPCREVAVPFPLGADAFDNLELLKLAEEDILGHIDKIRKRIKVLEAQKMEHHDPWAYV